MSRVWAAPQEPSLHNEGGLGWTVHKNYFKFSPLGEFLSLGKAGFGLTPIWMTMGGRRGHFSFSLPFSGLSRPDSVISDLSSPVSLKVKTRKAFLFCGCFIQWFLNLGTPQNFLEGLLKQSAGPTSRDSDSVGLW